MTSTLPINYAELFGYHSAGAAVLFILLYVPLGVYFTYQTFARRDITHLVMGIFCNVRIAAFGIRTILIESHSAGENVGLFITDQVLFGIGYSGLLYCAFTLVLDIEIVLSHPQATETQLHPFVRLAKNRFVFHMVLVAAMVFLILSTVAISKGNGTSPKSATLEHKVGIIIYLALTGLQAAQTVLLARSQMLSQTPKSSQSKGALGARHPMPILYAISISLLIREAFSIITVNDAVKQNTEHFWYPLIAAPELLVTALLTIPGLVPRREEIKERKSYQLNAIPFN